jgi:hypothetical protein
MEMVSKMKRLRGCPARARASPRFTTVPSLFTGDAGGGASNIRRYLIENDLLEAIIQLPNNLFYNTGITTYIWVLANNKRPRAARARCSSSMPPQLYASCARTSAPRTAPSPASTSTQITRALS